MGRGRGLLRTLGRRRATSSTSSGSGSTRSPFDPATGTRTGAAVAVVDDVLVSQTGGFAMAAVSSRGSRSPTSRSRSATPSGSSSGSTAPAGRPRPSASAAASSPPASPPTTGRSRSPSRERAATSGPTTSSGPTLSRLTSGEGTEFDPVWSRDGRELFYVLDGRLSSSTGSRSGRPTRDGRSGTSPRRSTRSASPSPPTAGRSPTRVSATQTGQRPLLPADRRHLAGAADPRHARDESNVSFSPDGRWVAYQSNETGRSEVYAEPFPGPGERVQVSSDGGTDPLWARRRRDLLPARRRAAASSRPGSRPRRGSTRPVPLFRFPIVPGTDHDSQTYDVTADGKRILAVTIPEGSRPQRMRDRRPTGRASSRASRREAAR